MYGWTFYLSEMKGVLVVLAIYFDCKALTKKPFDMTEKEEVHTKKMAKITKIANPNLI